MDRMMSRTEPTDFVPGTAAAGAGLGAVCAAASTASRLLRRRNQSSGHHSCQHEHSTLQRAHHRMLPFAGGIRSRQAPDRFERSTRSTSVSRGNLAGT